MNDVLLKHHDNGILTLTLNRPDKLNALTWELMRLLKESLEEASMDPAVRVVVLTGAGTGFCSGGDIRSAEQLDSDDPISNRWSADPAWRAYETRVSQVIRLSAAPILLHKMPKPTIAMVRGAAAGAGLCLAAACDFRIAGESAFFTTAYIKAARSGDWGVSYLLPQLVGAAKARELLLLGDRIDAQEALRLGLVSRVVADAELSAATQEIAARLARGPTAAYRYIKRNLALAPTMTLEQVIELEAHHIIRCSQTEDVKELARAAREDREADFRGY
jgi:2-(1,2-epoxy-1,2-dihydrophenyl)acetyl-CoA isomerase